VKRGYLEIHGGEAMAHQPEPVGRGSAALSFPQYSSELVEENPTRSARRMRRTRANASGG
jgi:hypothetical protein